MKTQPSHKNSPSKIRLNKFLSLCGLGSRRHCEKFIIDGRVKINNNIVTELATYVDSNDNISVNGKIIKPKNYIYILLNKPKSVITTLDDPRGRKHIGDLFPNIPFIKPVGRLDRNTTGVLLLTNDGDLHYRLTHPKYRISKIYSVTLDRKMSLKLVKKISDGVELDDGKIARGKILEINNKQFKSKIIIELKEGLNREIHRMFLALGYNVSKLDRIEYCGITYSGLKRNSWRNLSSEEVALLKDKCGL